MSTRQIVAWMIIADLVWITGCVILAIVLEHA